MDASIPRNFHPAIARWFVREYRQPTEVQSQAWAAIVEKKHTLIAAPTGSGKTLAGFLAIVNDLVIEGLERGLPQETRIVYVSPLKALSNDIEKNLQRPLQAIQDELESLRLPRVEIRVQVRTGDTPAGERAAMLKSPPHILVTTPESLYVLLTSDGGRKMLQSARIAIVDEIHALVGSKRGSHLALSLERLQSLVSRPLTRIGISATQKPLTQVADFLIGRLEPGAAPCTIIDVGHRRAMDLGIEIPRSPLGAVMESEVWDEIYERLVELISEHRTTLIFVNTRRLAERLSFQLIERLGADVVRAHHGSMSKEHRLDAEQRLKSGSLRALIATASLELGIDIGSVDLVCQISSPRSIAAFLQRVGRSGHSIHGTPKGRLFPLTRDELVECTALLDAVYRGELDRILMPEQPIDILAQQIIAETSCRECTEDELFALSQKAYPFRNLKRETFDEILTMLSEGFTTRRGRRGAYLHHDMVHRVVRARPAARLVALTSGGAIPDNFEYDVRLEPTDTFIGTLNEDFAIESSAGDIFQLANHSWKITRVNDGVVRVVDAGQAPPSIPFWLGEAPGRTIELSQAVARLREKIGEQLGSVEMLKPQVLSASVRQNPDGPAVPGKTPWMQPAVQWLCSELGLGLGAAEQLVHYVASGYLALEAMPTQDTIILERFFDEAGDMHLVIHAPFGNRMNRAWGLALRKKFCRKFNFELQAAATDDAIVLSLGSTHSFPIEEVFDYLNSKIARDTLIQAVFDSPMFEIRWRWNATRSLAMQRTRNGKRVPAQIQRMQAQDLVALVFPDQLACLENIVGEREIPDHPLVAQTIEDCLYEAMDIETLEDLLRQMENAQIRRIGRDLREPSPFAQEILNARPYAFLDPAPLEERRTRAIANRRWTDPSEAADLGKLDIQAIERVRSEAWPSPENTDELHDALTLIGCMTGQEIRPFQKLADLLIAQKRVAKISSGGSHAVYTSVERMPQFKTCGFEVVHPTDLIIPEKILRKTWERDKALVEIVRGRLEGLGPVTTARLAQDLTIAESEVHIALLTLENEGFVFRGSFTDPASAVEWCERRLLARIHRYTMERLRKEIEAVPLSDFMRFLLVWQHAGSADRLEGPEALLTIIEQMEGYEAAAVAWESDILPLRIAEYDPAMLDMACLSGRIVWGRVRYARTSGGSGPVKSTPIVLQQRKHIGLWHAITSADHTGSDALSHAGQAVYDFLKQRGASFFHEVAEYAGVLRSQAEDGMAELVALGLVTADSFNGLRALLVPAKYKTQSAHHRKLPPFSMDNAGRWGLIQTTFTDAIPVAEETALQFSADRLLKRYGVVFRRLVEREAWTPPWRDLVRMLRKMEARGEIRGGRFVESISGEQFALPEAVTKLRAIRREKPDQAMVALSAVDPLNLLGSVIPGDKVAALAQNRVLYQNGVPIAVLESGAFRTLVKVPENEEWVLREALIRTVVPPRLRPYLGKGIG